MKWFQTIDQPTKKSNYLVAEGKLANPYCITDQLLARPALLDSQAVRDLLEQVLQNLNIQYDDQDRILRADMRLIVNAERAAMIRALLAQEKRGKDGNLLPFSNSYRFTDVREREPQSGSFIATACLAVQERTKTGLTRLSIISVTTSLQQLLGTYMQPDSLLKLPADARAGVCQEVAQQVTSTLGQLNSSRVRGEVNFPTVESRDPKERQANYEAALDALVADLRPLERARLRDVFPNEYADDDPRGDRTIVHDERWFAVTRSIFPGQFNLFFVKGDSVKIVMTEQQIPAGVSARDHYAGQLDQTSQSVALSRPEKIRERGYTTTRLWYAAIPLADCDDTAVQDSIQNFRSATEQGLPVGFSRYKKTRTKSGWRRKISWRKIRTELLLPAPDGNIQPMPIMGIDKLPRNLAKKHVFIPILGNRDRFEQLLLNRNLQIAWTRIICRKGEWFLQITVRVPQPMPVKSQKVLGISFELQKPTNGEAAPQALIYWTLADVVSGQVLQHGQLANPNIAKFLAQKTNLEWDQKRGRWIGGKQFYRQLEETAHGTANQLIALAREHSALLAIEDIGYVQKSGRNSQQNVLFTAFNYGQLRNFASYKAQLNGLGVPWFVSDYITRLTCPDCGNRRKKGQTPETADTWITAGTLHCRKCSIECAVSGEQRSLRVALEGLAAWQRKQVKSS